MSDITTKLQSLSRWLRQLATHEPEPECKASHVECADDCVVAADDIHRLRMKVSGKDAEIASLRECGLAIGALSSAMGNPCVKANENGISGGLVALALHRMVEKDAEIATLREELRVTDQLLTERDRLLKSVPECKAHGDQCVPHAIEWVQSAAGEIARLREALSVIAYPLNIGKVYHMDAVTQARAALAQVAEVGK